MRTLRLLAPALLLAGATTADAADKVVNLYTARHYQTDERLYEDFTRATGIKVVRLEGKDDELVERLRQEGANSPADVLVTVDITRLARAADLGLFQPVSSKTLESRIPANLRGRDWFAFSTRARVIAYNKATVNPADVQTYEQLADAKLKGKVCSRNGSHPYNLSLGAALIAHDGVAATEAWARGIVANFARPPQGGDTDQLKAIAAGECGVAVSNSYYVARLLRSDTPGDKAVMAKVGIVWPNQKTWGTHLNVSGGGVAKHAKNRDHAVQFLEYLASDAAQRYFADGNNEWPAVQGVKVANPALDALGSFRADSIALEKLAPLTVEAQKVFDRAGYR